MIDELRRTELAEVSLAVLIALLWVRWAQSVLHRSPESAGARLPHLGQCDVIGVTAALDVVPPPSIERVWADYAHPVLAMLEQVSEELALILSEGRQERILATEQLLGDINDRLQVVAATLSHQINPGISRAGGMTLAVLFLKELAAQL